jgi:hypothetical protein
MTDEFTSDVCSTLVIPTILAKEDSECYNYGKKGHLSYNCPQSHNPGGSKGGRGQRGECGGRGSRGCGGREVVHLAVIEDSYNTIKVNAAEITELRRFKL